jgi:hypothetical protein
MEFMPTFVAAVGEDGLIEKLGRAAKSERLPLMFAPNDSDRSP